MGDLAFFLLVMAVCTVLLLVSMAVFLGGV